MLTLNDGRSELWQWDTGRTLSVDADCSQVHFSNNVFGRSIDVNVVDGVAIIPDVLLQSDKDLNVWAFVGAAENGYTKISKTFKVNRRNKPADYVFTPADQITLQTIQSQIGDLADLTTEAKDTLVSAINEAARTGGGGGGSTVELDTTLTQSGKAADAAAVGQELSSLSEEITNIPSGKDGADGITPTIGDNGNWYLGETDTGKPSRGNDGATGATGATGEKGTDGKSAYAYAVEGGYTGTEAEFAVKLAAEKLANPNALTFTGAVTGSYDGSAPLSVEIPSGGGNADRRWKLIKTLNVSTDVAQEYFDTDDNGNSFSVQEILITGTSPNIVTGYLYCRPSLSGQVGNSQLWPTNSKNFKWYLGIYNNLLKTTIAVSNNAIIGPFEKNESCPERITEFTVGASAGYNEAGTIYVYGR